MYESIQIRVNRDPNDTVLLLFQPSCTQPRSLYCIISNIKYVIIKECKQKDDLVNYTESATQSLSVYSVQYNLHHELLSSRRVVETMGLYSSENLPGGTHISRGSLNSNPTKYINETSDCNDGYNVAEQTVDCSKEDKAVSTEAKVKQVSGE